MTEIDIALVIDLVAALLGILGSAVFGERGLTLKRAAAVVALAVVAAGIIIGAAFLFSFPSRVLGIPEKDAREEIAVDFLSPSRVVVEWERFSTGRRYKVVVGGPDRSLNVYVANQRRRRAEFRVVPDTEYSVVIRDERSGVEITRVFHSPTAEPFDRAELTVMDVGFVTREASARGEMVVQAVELSRTLSAEEFAEFLSGERDVFFSFQYEWNAKRDERFEMLVAVGTPEGGYHFVALQKNFKLNAGQSAHGLDLTDMLDSAKRIGREFLPGEYIFKLYLDDKEVFAERLTFVE